MQLLLKQGHKIGKPVPLFVKIEPSAIDTLKSKYGGSQATAQPPTPTSPKLFETVAQAEKALGDQAAKVRDLKAKAEKSVWQPEVEILLEIKKQIENLKNKNLPVKVETVNVDDLEALVSQQGEKVRKMKSSGVDKAIWQGEVQTLLDLKKKLALAKGEPDPSTEKNKKKK